MAYQVKQSTITLSIAAKKTEPIQLAKCVEYRILNNHDRQGDTNRVYLNFNRGGKAKIFPIEVGETVTFKAGSGNLFNDDVYLYAEVAASNIVVLMTTRFEEIQEPQP